MLSPIASYPTRPIFALHFGKHKGFLIGFKACNFELHKRWGTILAILTQMARLKHHRVNPAHFKETLSKNSDFFIA